MISDGPDSLIPFPPLHGGNLGGGDEGGWGLSTKALCMNTFVTALAIVICLVLGFSTLTGQSGMWNGASQTPSSSTSPLGGSLSLRPSTNTPSTPGISYTGTLMWSEECSVTRFPMRYARLLNGTIVRLPSRSLCHFFLTSGGRGKGDFRSTFGNPRRV